MKNIYKMILLLLCCGNFSQTIKAQQLNRKMYSIAKNSSKPGWIDFDENANLNIATLFTENKIAFGLGSDDEMRLVSTKTNQSGNTHYRFQQYHKGYKVYGGNYIVHQNSSGVLYSANGKIISGLNNNVAVMITESAALEAGKATTGAKSFAWQDEALENSIKKKQHSEAATLFPKGELIWVPSSTEADANVASYLLCYKFDITTNEAGNSKTVYVSTENGSIVKELPLEITCSQTPQPSAYNGNVLVQTKYDYISQYTLSDSCGVTDVFIQSANFSGTQNNITNIYGVGGYDDFTGNEAGVSALWGLRNTQTYYETMHGISNYDTIATSIEGHVKVQFSSSGGGTTGNNASWSPSLKILNFGYGNSQASEFDDYVSLDVCGHEFTHAVTGFSAGLIYQGESGALNESFSDIFGEVIENFTLGTNDWILLGELGGIRSMANPDLFSDPRTYNDTLWVQANCASPSATNDYCGVHTNSGVQNHMFYYLCNGGSGTNYFGKEFKINGIGMPDAAQIAFHALTEYMVPTSTYIDAREAWIHAAQDIFGSCSNQAIQTANAWHAVGVGYTLSNYSQLTCGNYPRLILDDYVNAISSISTSLLNCGTIISTSNHSVSFKAGTFIQLNPGFHAESGCHFTAYINQCTITNYKPAGPVNEQSLYNSVETQNKTSVQVNLMEVAVSPNPFNEELNINLNLSEGNEATIQLFDMLGKETNVPSFTDNFDAGINQIKLNTSQLNKGIYLLVVKCNNQIQTLKVVK